MAISRSWVPTRPAPATTSLDAQRRADRCERVEPLDVAVADADAAVRRTPGDEAGLVRPVDADDAAAGPVGQHVRVGGRPHRARAVERAAGHAELLADPERARGGVRAGRPDADARAEPPLAVLVQGDAERAAVHPEPGVEE